MVVRDCKFAVWLVELTYFILYSFMFAFVGSFAGN